MKEQTVSIDEQDECNEQVIRARMREYPELGLISDLLLEYDWDNRHDHLAWAATAPISEILFWAKEIRDSETADADFAEYERSTIRE